MTLSGIISKTYRKSHYLVSEHYQLLKVEYVTTYTILKSPEISDGAAAGRGDVATAAPLWVTQLIESGGGGAGAATTRTLRGV
jgi:hypothetical protein